MITAEKINEPYYRLKMVMNQKGVKQRDLAELLERDVSTINQKINRSSGRDFSLSEAQKVAEYLNVDIGDFF